MWTAKSCGPDLPTLGSSLPVFRKICVLPTRRGLARCILTVIASEAKQSMSPQADRWIASSPSLLPGVDPDAGQQGGGLEIVKRLRLHHGRGMPGKTPRLRSVR